MRVRAKWNVKDGSGWHSAGEVFETTSDLGDAVEVLDAPKHAEPVPVKQEPVKEREPEAAAEPEKAPAETKPRSASRRKKSE